jgi:hypothetical protein
MAQDAVERTVFIYVHCVRNAACSNGLQIGKLTL